MASRTSSFLAAAPMAATGPPMPQAVLSTVRRLRVAEPGLNAALFLDRNDSYHFLQATGDLLITGPTFTNVMDLQIMLVG